MPGIDDDEKRRAAALQRETDLIAELRRQRERRRESQKDVAERLGASHQTISQRERLEYRASVQDFILWAEAIGLELDVQLRPAGDLGELYPVAVALLPLVWAAMSNRDRRRLIADWRLILGEEGDPPG